MLNCEDPFLVSFGSDVMVAHFLKKVLSQAREEFGDDALSDVRSGHLSLSNPNHRLKGEMMSSVLSQWEVGRDEESPILVDVKSKSCHRFV